MEVKLSNLEKTLLGTRPLALASGALVASGVKSSKILDDYIAKIDTLCLHVKDNYATGSDLQIAKELFNWLWETKPERYEYNGNFKLPEVVDGQINPDADKVGNCLGLSVLYNVLAQRLGLKIHSIYLEEAFGRESHVFSVLDMAQGAIDIENILPDGFNYKGHLRNTRRIQWCNAELIADIYHSSGNALFVRGDIEEAIQTYSKAIILNPQYNRAYLNRGIALSAIGRDNEARQDFSFGLD